jgi:hypothetical protein
MGRRSLKLSPLLFSTQYQIFYRERPNPRAKMLFRPVNEPAPALLSKRMNEAPSNGLGEYFVAGIEPFCGHDPQGELTGIQWAGSERFLAKVDGLAALEAAMNVNVGRDFFDISGSFKDRDGRRYVCKIGARLREPLFIVGDCGYDFSSL